MGQPGARVGIERGSARDAAGILRRLVAAVSALLLAGCAHESLASAQLRVASAYRSCPAYSDRGTVIEVASGHVYASFTTQVDRDAVRFTLEGEPTVDVPRAASARSALGELWAVRGTSGAASTRVPCFFLDHPRCARLRWDAMDPDSLELAQQGERTVIYGKRRVETATMQTWFVLAPDGLLERVVARMTEGDTLVGDFATYYVTRCDGTEREATQ